MLRDILAMPLGEERGRPLDEIYGPEARTLPAPWVADEFPELRGDSLPPPLDYLCDDEPIFPLVRERWRRRFAASFALRVGRLLLAALTIAGLLMIFWPESRLRQAALASIVVVWGPLVLILFGEYYRLWASRAKWRQPRLLMYPTDRHMLHEIHMTPLQPRDLLLAQWLRAVAPRPAKPPKGWRPGARVHTKTRVKVLLTIAATVLVFSITAFAVRRLDWAARITLLVVWIGGTGLWLTQRAFAGASLAWIFPIPPMPDLDTKGRYTLRWWQDKIESLWAEFILSMERLAVSLVITIPFAALIITAIVFNVITWSSPAFFFFGGLTGAAFIALGHTPFIHLGQRYARWLTRYSVAEFEKRARRLRDRQLALLDANKPLPRPR